MVDLARFTSEIGTRFPDEWGLRHLDHHHLLAAWWVFSQLTSEDVTEAKAALIERPDGGVDAVYFDHARDTVYLVQSKFHGKLDYQESEPQLSYLGKWAGLMAGLDAAFAAALAGLSSRTAAQLRSAREAAKDRGYRVELHYVSTGRASENALKRQPASFRFYSGRRILKLYDDYAAGVLPVAELSFEVARDYVDSMASGGTPAKGTQLGIYLLPGSEIYKAVRSHGERIFARNVRGYLGETAPVNTEIVKTLRDDPSKFRYLNNGLTIVCDRSKVELEAGKHVLRLWNPQVVNGQQTSRSIGSDNVTLKEAAKVDVVTKVVTVNREQTSEAEYDQIVREVVKATNLQTKIKPSDLRSNDKMQVELFRALRRLDHYYARKVEQRGNYLLKAAGNPFVTRGQLAHAVAGCLWETLSHRETKESLYHDKYYASIFDPEQAKRSLVCHYLWKAVDKRLGKSTLTVRAQSRWLALFAIWERYGMGLVRNAPKFISFSSAARQDTTKKNLLDVAIDATGDAVCAFFAVHSKKLGLQSEPVRFFKRDNLYPELDSYLGGVDGKPHKTSINNRISAFLAAL